MGCLKTTYRNETETPFCGVWKRGVGEKELKDPYDYGWRQYDPALGRWHAPDPSSDQYYSLSPYNYVANNPLLFIDPDGRVIDGDTERVEDLKDEANRPIKYENKRQSRLQAKIDKRSAAGKSTKGQERRLANSEARESQLNEALTEISALEASETVYYINSDYQDQADGTSGNTSYDASNNRINVDVSQSYGLAGLAHELKHAYQFETGKVDFVKTTGGPGLLYDITDEVSAFRRQFAFNPNSLGNINSFSQINSFSVRRLNPNYANLPGNSLDTSWKLKAIEMSHGGQRVNLNLTNGQFKHFGVRYSEAGYTNLISK